MRRAALALCVLAAPAAAWEFEARPVCTLSHVAAAAKITVTYDPRAAQPYAIRLILAEGTWGEGPVFAMRFEGARPVVISTDRHAVEGGALTVTDRGFGNVLAGIEAGGTVRAATAGREVSVPLAGAAGPVAAFRACTEAGVA